MKTTSRNQKQFMISIPEPCSEDWSRMTEVDAIHRHCDSCAKNVIDFSGMTDDELVLFLHNKSGNLCGRFRKEQLNRPYREIPEPKHTSSWWKAAVLLPLSLFARQGKAQQDSVAVNDSLLVQQDSTMTPPDSAFVVNGTTQLQPDTALADVTDSTQQETLYVRQPKTTTVTVELVVSAGSMIYGGFGMPAVPETKIVYISGDISGEVNSVPHSWWTTPFPWLTRYLPKPKPVIASPDPTLPLNEKDPVADANKVPPLTNTVDSPWYSALVPVRFRRRKK